MIILQRRIAVAKKMLLIFLTAILFFSQPFAAQGENQKEKFYGSFYEKRYIRIKPEQNTKVLAWVPKNTILDLTPVEGTNYAKTIYQNKEGYIYYKDVTVHSEEEALAQQNEKEKSEKTEETPLPTEGLLVQPSTAVIKTTPQPTTDTKFLYQKGEELSGYFNQRMYIRPEPQKGSNVALGNVPPYERIKIVVENESYGAITYGEKSGYVYLGNFIQENYSIEWIDPYYAYSTVFVDLYLSPYGGEKPIYVYPSHSPLKVVGKNGESFMVQKEEEEEIFFVKGDLLQEIGENQGVEPYEAFGEKPLVVYTLPLEGASGLGVITQPDKLYINAHNGSFALVTFEGKDGYVLLKDIKSFEPVEVDFFVVLENTVPLYGAANHFSANGKTIEKNSLVKIDFISNEFFHIEGEEAFILQKDARQLYVKPIEETLCFWEEEKPIYANERKMPQAYGSKLPEHTMVLSKWEIGNYYLIYQNGAWGLIEKEQGKIISKKLSAHAKAVYANKETFLYEKPDRKAGRLEKTLPKNSPLWVDYELGDFYLLFIEEEMIFVLVEDFETVGVNEPLTAREVYIEKEQTLLDFPLEGYGNKKGAIQGNQLVTLLQKNGEYYYIQYEDQEGFVKKNQVWELDEVVSGSNYYLFVNKEDFTITVYRADEKGQRTQEVVRTITTALGKRTTPTPTGIFVLGEKKPWHFFTTSYAPFAITYTSGKFLHGPLYAAKSTRALKVASTASFGTNATGGCLRIPYEDSLWLYFHTVSGETPMEIVNGVVEKEIQ